MADRSAIADSRFRAAEGEDAVRLYQDRFRLAYQDDALVKLVPGTGTVLANEEVIDGKSERGSHPVQRIPLRQWMLRITSYAERLIEGLDELDCLRASRNFSRLDRVAAPAPKSTSSSAMLLSAAFEAWKGTRAKSGFPTSQTADRLASLYHTTDTLYGATYMVIAPEHPQVERLTMPSQQAEVEAYRAKASFKSDRERTEGDRAKTGVFTGSYAINPVTGKPIPIWIADYVLATYGTGAIMAVPAHDDRDFEFAQAFNLPVVCSGRSACRSSPASRDSCG